MNDPSGTTADTSWSEKSFRKGAVVGWCAVGLNLLVTPKSRSFAGQGLALHRRTVVAVKSELARPDTLSVICILQRAAPADPPSRPTPARWSSYLHRGTRSW